MANLPIEEEETLDQSNSGAADDQTVDQVEQTVDDNSDGNTHQDDTDSNNDDNEEGRQTRNEKHHDRYIDRLSNEIRIANEQSSRSTGDIFPATQPYKPLELKDGETYEPEQLEQDRKSAAANARNEGMAAGYSQAAQHEQKERWADRLESDSERVTAKYKALQNDTDNKEYDPDLEADLVQNYMKFIGLTKDAKTGVVNIEKPNIRFRDYVEAEMQRLEKYAERQHAQSSRNITSQASKTGMRPNGQSRTSSGGHGFDPNDPVGSVNRMSRKQYFELGGKEASDAYLAQRGLAPKA
jgi:hypothetical protein